MEKKDLEKIRNEIRAKYKDGKKIVEEEEKSDCGCSCDSSCCK